MSSHYEAGANKTGNDEASDDSGYNSDELNDLLANMDIDKDFNMWSSFRSSIVSKGGEGVECSLGEDGVKALPTVLETSPSAGSSSEKQEVKQAESPADLEQEDLDKWSKRLSRDEVYSRRYRPDEAEVKELLQLESFLGMGKRRSLRNVLFRRKSDSSVASSSDPNGPDRESWDRLIHPEEGQPASILLKRGPVLWENNNEQECELILLTHGLIIATTVPNDNNKTNSPSKVVLRKFEQAIPWNKVKFVAPSVTERNAWELHLKGDDPNSFFIFVCATFRQKEAWIDAMESCLIHSAMHSRDVIPTSELGWQYQLVLRPAFTMAVTGQKVIAIPPDFNLDELDSYNGYAPLHYAVRANRLEAVRCLLDVGANPNVLDEDQRSPMYYAVRDELPQMLVQTLESYGANKSRLAETEQKGELFGRVAATDNQMEEKRREQEQKRQAEAAASQMAENMRLLQQRGEKIEDMSSKADELNEGAKNFADMAKELKERSKKKKWYQL